MDALSQHGVESELLRVLDFNVLPRVTSDEGEGDKWPRLRLVLAADILVVASPIWLGQPS